MIIHTTIEKSFVDYLDAFHFFEQMLMNYGSESELKHMAIRLVNSQYQVWMEFEQESKHGEIY